MDGLAREQGSSRSAAAREPSMDDETEKSPAPEEQKKRETPDRAVVCPFCGGREVELFSLFGSQLLTSEYYCRNCRTVFEQVKR